MLTICAVSFSSSYSYMILNCIFRRNIVRRSTQYDDWHISRVTEFLGFHHSLNRRPLILLFVSRTPHSQTRTWNCSYHYSSLTRNLLWSRASLLGHNSAQILPRWVRFNSRDTFPSSRVKKLNVANFLLPWETSLASSKGAQTFLGS